MESLAMQMLLSYKLFPGSTHTENLALFRMKAQVLSVLPHKDLVKVILILFCGDKALTDDIISKQSGVESVCWGRSLMYRKNTETGTEPCGMPNLTRM